MTHYSVLVTLVRCLCTRKAVSIASWNRRGARRRFAFGTAGEIQSGSVSPVPSTIGTSGLSEQTASTSREKVTTWSLGIPWLASKAGGSATWRRVVEQGKPARVDPETELYQNPAASLSERINRSTRDRIGSHILVHR